MSSGCADCCLSTHSLNLCAVFHFQNEKKNEKESLSLFITQWLQIPTSCPKTTVGHSSSPSSFPQSFPSCTFSVTFLQNDVFSNEKVPFSWGSINVLKRTSTVISKKPKHYCELMEPIMFGLFYFFVLVLICVLYVSIISQHSFSRTQPSICLY